jgi:hypothetical protein
MSYTLIKLSRHLKTRVRIQMSGEFYHSTTWLSLLYLLYDKDI